MVLDSEKRGSSEQPTVSDSEPRCDAHEPIRDLIKSPKGSPDYLRLSITLLI